MLAPSNFLKNTSVLVAGSFVSQLIAFLTIPILSRLFTPAEFGFFAVFNSISTIIATIATLRFDYAIMLPQKDEDAVKLLSLSFLTLAITLIISTLFILLFKEQITHWLNHKNFSFWLYFIPLNVLTIAAIQILSFWLNRKKDYKKIAGNHIARGATYPVATIAIRKLTKITSALITGHLIAQFVSMLMFFYQAKKSLFKYSLTLKELKESFYKYKDFPLKNLPATLLSILSFQAPLLLIGSLFSASNVGQYSQTLVILFAPINLIGSAVAKVFHQHAAVAKQEKKLFALAQKTSLYLFLLAIVPSATIMIWGKDLFILFLGKRWVEAGQISQILIPYFLLRFIFFSQISVLSIIRKNGIEAILNLLLMVSQIGSVLIGYYLLKSYLSLFWMMSVSATIIYIFCGFFILKGAYENDQ